MEGERERGREGGGREGGWEAMALAKNPKSLGPGSKHGAEHTWNQPRVPIKTPLRDRNAKCLGRQ